MVDNGVLFLFGAEGLCKNRKEILEQIVQYMRQKISGTRIETGISPENSMTLH